MNNTFNDFNAVQSKFFADLDATLQQKDQSIADSTKQLVDLNNQIPVLNGKITDLNGQVSTLSSQKNDLTTQNATLTDLLKKSNDSIGTLTNQVTTLTTQLTTANSLKRKPDVGINVHFFNSAMYTDVDATIANIIDMKLSFVRLDFFINADGSMQQEALFTKIIAPKLHKAGIKIYPMLNTTGLSVSSTADAQYTLGYALGNGFATRYGKYFQTYELGNEISARCILTNGDGRKAAGYDPVKLASVAGYLKGMHEGIRAYQPLAVTQLNGQWLNTYFIDYCLANGVAVDELTWHWYTNQEGVLASQLWNTSKALIEDYLATKYPNMPIRYNEVGYYNPTAPFDQAKQTSLLSTLFSRLYNKGYEIALYQMYDQPERMPNFAEATYGLYDGNKAPKAVVNQLKQLI